MRPNELRHSRKERAATAGDDFVARLQEGAPWERRMAELMRSGADEFTARRQALAEARTGTTPLGETVLPAAGGRAVALVESARDDYPHGQAGAAEVAALPPRSRALFEQWRAVGRTDDQALTEVRRSGLIEEEQLEEQFRARGMSPEAARIAARGREGDVPPADPFDALVEAFQRCGLSPEAARIAAIGRDSTEAEARQEMHEAARAHIAARTYGGHTR
ncbi:hypothetical protein [Streptosporangium sandarakinum]|uniref:hypothetical protein n=1 Tax=Streptosporangium sandarakinum TaxID=1260955 RepID=UPI00379A7F4A